MACFPARCMTPGKPIMILRYARSGWEKIAKNEQVP
jgi:hypothetical protein